MTVNVPGNTEQSDMVVLLIQVLILHNNDLRSLLPKGCDIRTLSTLKVMYTISAEIEAEIK